MFGVLTTLENSPKIRFPNPKLLKKKTKFSMTTCEIHTDSFILKSPATTRLNYSRPRTWCCIKYLIKYAEYIKHETNDRVGIAYESVRQS